MEITISLSEINEVLQTLSGSLIKQNKELHIAIEQADLPDTSFKPEDIFGLREANSKVSNLNLLIYTLNSMIKQAFAIHFLSPDKTDDKMIFGDDAGIFLAHESQIIRTLYETNMSIFEIAKKDYLRKNDRAILLPVIKDLGGQTETLMTMVEKQTGLLSPTVH